MDTKELIGKKILNAEIIELYKDCFGNKHKEGEFDDRPILRLTMEDNSIFEVISDYGGYTGDSQDEYPRLINVRKVEDNGFKVIGDSEATSIIQMSDTGIVAGTDLHNHKYSYKEVKKIIEKSQDDANSEESE